MADKIISIEEVGNDSLLYTVEREETKKKIYLYGDKVNPPSDQQLDNVMRAISLYSDDELAKIMGPVKKEK